MPLQDSGSCVDITYGKAVQAEHTGLQSPIPGRPDMKDLTVTGREWKSGKTPCPGFAGKLYLAHFASGIPIASVKAFTVFFGNLF